MRPSLSTAADRVVDAVRGSDRGREMLEPVLDPLDRPANDPRRRGDQHDVGGDPLLDAEASPESGGSLSRSLLPGTFRAREMTAWRLNGP